jgi:DNA-3-methyladenine glycosylase
MESDSQMKFGEPIEADFFKSCVDDVARSLIGCFLFVDEDGDRVGGQIIDTEAYCQNDPAAHCHKDKDSRFKKEFKNGVCLFEDGVYQKSVSKRMHDSMYMSGGHIYVYPNNKDSSNGCYLNFACGEENFGSGVLIRALKAWPASVQLMKKRRENNGASLQSLRDPRNLCSGPNMICQTLGVTHEYDGRCLYDIKPPLKTLNLYKPIDKIDDVDAWCGSRIGIKVAVDWPRRYVLRRSSALLSKPLKDGGPYSPALMQKRKQDGELKSCEGCASK